MLIAVSTASTSTGAVQTLPATYFLDYPSISEITASISRNRW
jgi:hypothetical protein